MSRHTLRRIAALALVALAVTAGSALAEDYEAPLWAKSFPTAAAATAPAPAATTAAPAWGPGSCPRAPGAAAGRSMMGMHGMRGQMVSTAATAGHPGHGSHFMHGWDTESR